MMEGTQEMRGLFESRGAYEKALASVHLALNAERNEAARKELTVTWNRLAGRLEEIQSRIHRLKRREG